MQTRKTKLFKLSLTMTDGKVLERTTTADTPYFAILRATDTLMYENEPNVSWYFKSALLKVDVEFLKDIEEMRG